MHYEKDNPLKRPSDDYGTAPILLLFTLNGQRESIPCQKIPQRHLMNHPLMISRCIDSNHSTSTAGHSIELSASAYDGEAPDGLTQA